MGIVKKYATPLAFRAALNEKLRQRARAAGTPVDRVRTLAVMERFLARVVAVFPPTMVLKGGLALELRLEKARTTKDIDLRVLGDPNVVRALLAEAARRVVEPEDYLTFTAEPDAEHPTVHGDGVIYDGVRYRVTPLLAGERYGDVFGVDVSFGDVLHGEVTEFAGGDAFAFIGVPPVVVRVYPAASHVAEKLHAYTLPRPDGSENSRVKDLPDLALLASVEGLVAADLRLALAKTFAFRATHPVPAAFPDPPANWAVRYRRMAEEEGLPWLDLASVTAVVRAFLDPVLGVAEGDWSPAMRRWR
ncbi:MAG: nucleotidyl transferase AbiEii/AbiGii toxin family protein [Deltaproteobacteria bacterium]|nr:nucleotidyl transferase AbiEii/AbiGii toxin family protein [Deltaproteobacteria bacterium]